jgi:hypothetical protein
MRRCAVGKQPTLDGRYLSLLPWQCNDGRVQFHPPGRNAFEVRALEQGQVAVSGTTVNKSLFWMAMSPAEALRVADEMAKAARRIMAAEKEVDRG